MLVWTTWLSDGRLFVGRCRRLRAWRADNGAMRQSLQSVRWVGGVGSANNGARAHAAVDRQDAERP